MNRQAHMACNFNGLIELNDISSSQAVTFTALVLLRFQNFRCWSVLVGFKRKTELWFRFLGHSLTEST